MKKVFSFTISASEARQRLDRFISTQLKDMSRSSIQKLIESGHITLNGKRVKVGERLHLNDEIKVSVPPPEPSQILPEGIGLDILFEDDDILLINKPAGMVVHPAAGHAGGTLVNALLQHDAAIAAVGGADRPGIVHRLDKGTSGIMIVARTEAARLSLVRQFKDRTIEKEYWTLVHGIPVPAVGRFETAIGRHPRHRKKFAAVPRGKEAHTEYQVLESFGQLFAAVQVRLHTGRTHQIRVHFSEAGHPIVGDKTYGGRRDTRKTVPEDLRQLVQGLDRPALHASVLGFTHPVSEKSLRFEAPLPDDLQELVQGLKSLQ